MIEIQGPTWRWGRWWWRVGGVDFNNGYAWTEKRAKRAALRAIQWQNEDAARQRARKHYTIKVPTDGL